MTREQFKNCKEHNFKDCDKCLLMECPYATDYGDGFSNEEVEE